MRIKRAWRLERRLTVFDLIRYNLPTILVGAALTVGLVGVAWRMRKDRKSGKSSCGCGCASCPSAKICHTKQKLR